MINQVQLNGDESPCYVTSSDQVSRRGVYDSERAARYSFQFRDEVLTDLQDSVNPGGVITFAMLQQARQERPDGSWGPWRRYSDGSIR